MTRPIGSQLSSITVDIGSLRFGWVDANGVEWWLINLDGWLDSPDTTGQTTQRTGQDGAWISPAFLTARVVTVTAWLNAPTMAARDGALATLFNALPMDPTALLRVDGTPSSQAWVRRQGEVKVSASTLTTADVQFSLLAPDPRRYATTTTDESMALPAVSGSNIASVENTGDTDAPWAATIHGPVTDPKLTNQTTGMALGFTLTLASGDYLAIDALEGTALLNGTTSRTGYITSGTGWWSLVPGTNSIAYSGTSAGSTVDFTPYSSWS